MITCGITHPENYDGRKMYHAQNRFNKSIQSCQGGLGLHNQQKELLEFENRIDGFLNREKINFAEQPNNVTTNDSCNYARYRAYILA